MRPLQKSKNTWFGGFGSFFSFCSGRGRGESEAPGGDRFFIEKPRRGGGRPGGAERPGGCLRRIGEFLGGGLNIFFENQKWRLRNDSRAGTCPAQITEMESVTNSFFKGHEVI